MSDLDAKNMLDMLAKMVAVLTKIEVHLSRK
jgi:hypothetical protein